MKQSRVVLFSGTWGFFRKVYIFKNLSQKNRACEKISVVRKILNEKEDNRKIDYAQFKYFLANGICKIYG